MPRYFEVRRGVSAYSLVSGQGPQFAVNVINCQLREATFVLDGLLHQKRYRIQEHYRNTHGYTELLGPVRGPGCRIRADRLRDFRIR